MTAAKLRTNRQQTGDPQTNQVWDRLADLNKAVTSLQQLFSGVDSLTAVHKLADQVIKVTTATVITDLDLTVVAGQAYRFSYAAAVQSNDAVHNVAAGLRFPKASRFAATLRVIVAAAGVSGEWAGALTSSGALLSPSGPLATNTDYLLAIEGVIIPASTGPLQLIGAAQNAADNVTFRQGSSAFLWNLGAA